MLPLDVLKSKCQEYVDAGLVDEPTANAMVRTIESERGAGGVVNEANPDASDADDQGANGHRPLAKLSMEQMKTLLRKREQQMQEGASGGGVTDQWRALFPVITGGVFRLEMQSGD